MLSYSRLSAIQRAVLGVGFVSRDHRLIPGRVPGSKRSSKQAYRDYSRAYMRLWRARRKAKLEEQRDALAALRGALEQANHRAAIAEENYRVAKEQYAALEASWRERGEALKPFSAYPEYCDYNEWDDNAKVGAVNGSSELLCLTMADLRRARSALKGETP